MKITFVNKGDFSKADKYFRKITQLAFSGKLDRYGQMGVQALASATPVDTGLTAASWDYQIETSSNEVSIVWTNSNVNNGVPIAIILQYGHGTGTGGYVQGIDYINPALKPVFDEIEQSVWEEVTNL